MAVGAEKFRRAAAKADGELHTKLVVLPNIISEWVGGLDNKRILDFGCGEGLVAAGIALGHQPESVVGVDINDESQRCLEVIGDVAGVTALPSNLRFETIRPGEVGGADRLDVIYAWSVFEHVATSIFDNVVTMLRDKLSERGRMFIQISPLYFSPEGSHLWAINYNSWEHLSKQTSEIYDDLHRSTLSAESQDALWSMFLTLNRVTASTLCQRFERLGLKLIRSQRDTTDKSPPDELKEAYSIEALKTFQVVALFEKM